MEIFSVEWIPVAFTYNKIVSLFIGYLQKKMKAAWYEIFFKNYARRYESESFTQGTSGDDDYIENEPEINIFLQVEQALKHGGKFILTTLNGVSPLLHSVKDFPDSENKESSVDSTRCYLNLVTFRDNLVVTSMDDMLVFAENSRTKTEL